MKYIDGNVKNSEGRKLLDNGNGKNIPKAPSQRGMEAMEKIMIQGTGEQAESSGKE